MFEPMQPWMAYMTLQVLPMIKAGYSPQSGVDVELTGDAKQAAKPVLGFETVSQQLHLLADFPQPQQVELLHQELVDLPKSAEQTDRMMEDWTKGNVEAIADMENGEFRSRSPELYKKLVVERNQRWAEQLATLLKSDKPGVAFVAVGAAHLAGRRTACNINWKGSGSSRCGSRRLAYALVLSRPNAISAATPISREASSSARVRFGAFHSGSGL